MQSNCFAPLAQPNATLLILGSMPGVASLTHQQYYAHPQNAFWPILSSVFNWPETLNYAQHCERLMSHQIALWDVLSSCERPGSLDSRIDKNTIQINNFTDFLQQHPQIQRIAFNGGKARELFRRYVEAELQKDYKLYLMPSTSPAYAAMRFEQKKAKWQDVLLDKR